MSASWLIFRTGRISTFPDTDAVCNDGKVVLAGLCNRDYKAVYFDLSDTAQFYN